MRYTRGHYPLSFSECGKWTPAGKSTSPLSHPIKSLFDIAPGDRTQAPLASHHDAMMAAYRDFGD
eukprot:768746-Hanusia_phi.AAC.12